MIRRTENQHPRVLPDGPAGGPEAYPDRYRPNLAGSLTNLGILFSELSRSAEALPVVEEAVEIYRELAAAHPDRYRTDLSRSLQALAELTNKTTS